MKDNEERSSADPREGRCDIRRHVYKMRQEYLHHFQPNYYGK